MRTCSMPRSSRTGQRQSANCADRTSDALIHINDVLEMEARRIAHALHDEAGHMLTAVHLKLAEMERQMFNPAI